MRSIANAGEKTLKVRCIALLTSLLIAAGTFGQQIPQKTVTFEEPKLVDELTGMYPVINGQQFEKISIDDAHFTAGRLSTYLSGPGHGNVYATSGCYNCWPGTIYIDIPRGSTNVSLDVRGDGREWNNTCLPVEVYDGQDRWLGPPDATAPDDCSDGAAFIMHNVSVPVATSGRITVTVHPNVYGNRVGHMTLDNLKYTPPNVTRYRIEASLMDSADTEAHELPTSVTVPLGVRFALRLQRSEAGSWSDVPSVYELGAAQLVDVSAASLYPQTALLQFDAASTSDEKVFQGVHIGSQVLVVKPSGSSFPTQQLSVSVYQPLMLGSSHHTVVYNNESFNLDGQIVKWANRRGIPPQIIKGLMTQETGTFSPMTWRYEPLTTDWPGFELDGHDDRSLDKYDPYRIEFDEDNTHYGRGVMLIDAEDVHPRAVFLLDKAAGTYILPDGLQDVKASNIVLQNDFWQHWVKNYTSDKVVQGILKTDAGKLSLLNWNAQTTLASSYGLMQVLFEESFVTDYKGIGVKGSHRPFYLFDLATNIALGGGSIQVGTAVFANKFGMQADFEGLDSATPAFVSSGDCDVFLAKSLARYNGSWSKKHPKDISKYGSLAFGFSLLYPPSVTSSLLH